MCVCVCVCVCTDVCVCVCVCVSGVCRQDYRALMLERSGVSETLVMSLALTEEQLPVKLCLLQTLQILSRTSGDQSKPALALGASRLHLNLPVFPDRSQL